MPKRTDIQSILIIGLAAALLATSAAAEVIRKEEGPPGYYSVGPWEGRCVRDGWLSGAKHESCGAQLFSPSMDIRLVRTVKRLTITLSSKACSKSVFKAAMSSKQLALPNRATRLEATIQGLVKKEAKKCGGKSTLPAPITTADLNDILDETDGLEF
jgi:hypothetical protein